MVDVGGGQITQSLMVAIVVVVIYGGVDLVFEVARQEVIFQQNPVLYGLVPALDLVLGLVVMWCHSNMIYALAPKVIGQIRRDIG